MTTTERCMQDGNVLASCTSHKLHCVGSSGGNCDEILVRPSSVRTKNAFAIADSDRWQRSQRSDRAMSLRETAKRKQEWKTTEITNVPAVEYSAYVCRESWSWWRVLVCPIALTGRTGQRLFVISIKWSLKSTTRRFWNDLLLSNLPIQDRNSKRINKGSEMGWSTTASVRSHAHADWRYDRAISLKKVWGASFE